jgi:hypothetical protein
MKHPFQPIVFDQYGVARFQKNELLDWLQKAGVIDLNEIAVLCHEKKFSDDDQAQLAQLIGYSVSGWGSLSFVTPEDCELADGLVEQLVAARENQS